MRRCRATVELSPCFVVLLLVVAGCQPQDQIRHYQVARPTPPHRLLAAIVPQGDRGWFFKLTGANERVAAEEDRFRAFLESVRFGAEDDADPKWELPEGWTQTRGEGMRFATIEIPADGKSLELTVIVLPGQGTEESLLPNINRWRGQIGLAPIEADDLREETKQLDVAGTTATVVNLAGKLGQSAPMAAPFAGGAGAGDSVGGDAGGHTHELSYEAPPNWKPGQRVVSRGGISLRRDAAFVIGEGEQQAEVTITSLPAAAGATLPNVNRWRRQVGLAPLSQRDLDEATKGIDVNGEPAEYFRLVGSEQAILGVISMHGGKAWFTKLQGPQETAVEMEEEFKAFVRSIKY